MTTEVEINVGGRILSYTEVENGIYRFLVEDINKPKVPDGFIFVEAESLSLGDKFMQWRPWTPEQRRLKKGISLAIEKGVRNFYRSKYDPAFTEDGEGICFIPGKPPALGQSYDWWESVAKSFCPERNSRLETRLEYWAFLGVLIKKIIEEYGESVKWAWNAVCYDSRELGNYSNSLTKDDDLGTGAPCRLTGERRVCGFYDLANTFKMLERGDNGYGYWLASGSWKNFSRVYPISTITHTFGSNIPDHTAVGSIILS